MAKRVFILCRIKFSYQDVNFCTSTNKFSRILEGERIIRVVTIKDYQSSCLKTINKSVNV